MHHQSLTPDPARLAPRQAPWPGRAAARRRCRDIVLAAALPLSLKTLPALPLPPLPAIAAATAAAAAAGIQPPPNVPASGASGASGADAMGRPRPPAPATPLAALLAELEQRSPRLLAERHAWSAMTAVPSQVSTLPDPQINLQQVNVGSPLPFAGYTTSDFAYVGLGVSQDVPFPGKLRLRGEIAQREAAAAGDRAEAVRRVLREQLSVTYIRLGYLQQTLGILEREEALLREIAEVAGARYGAGQGNQQDVLRAQLERTKLLREIELHRRETTGSQAQLRQLLGRPPTSPDVTAEPLVESAMPAGAEALLSGEPAGNPEVAGAEEAVRRESLRVELARKDFYPDFSLQAAWQRTDPAKFRAYYMVNLSVRLPLHRLRRQQPELAQAAAELERSRSGYEAAVQQTWFDLRDQLAAADGAARTLAIYRGGLLLQAAAAFEAALAAYRAGSQDFTSLLGSLADRLHLEVDYWNTVAEHETALARIERLHGRTLP